MTTEIVNLTPHEITVFLSDGSSRVYPSQGIARCKEDCSHVGDIEGVPVFDKRYGDAYGIPAPTEGRYYIVSFYLRALLRDRTDILVPHDLVRDSVGSIVGCRAFSLAENITIT